MTGPNLRRHPILQRSGVLRRPRLRAVTEGAMPDAAQVQLSEPNARGVVPERDGTGKHHSVLVAENDEVDVQPVLVVVGVALQPLGVSDSERESATRTGLGDAGGRSGCAVLVMCANANTLTLRSRPCGPRTVACKVVWARRASICCVAPDVGAGVVASIATRASKHTPATLLLFRTYVC